MENQFIVPNIPGVSLTFLNNTPILLIIFIVFFVVYAIVSAVLIYHWFEYGMNSVKVALAETVYVVVSLVLLTISFLALNYY